MHAELHAPYSMREAVIFLSPHDGLLCTHWQPGSSLDATGKRGWMSPHETNLIGVSHLAEEICSSRYGRVWSGIRGMAEGKEDRKKHTRNIPYHPIYSVNLHNMLSSINKGPWMGQRLKKKKSLFQVRPTDFVQPIQGQTSHECINHNIVVGLCSELFMRLSYYIHLRFSGKLLAQMGIEPRSFRLWDVYSTPRPER